jgi:hypothetical protein
MLEILKQVSTWFNNKTNCRGNSNNLDKLQAICDGTTINNPWCHKSTLMACPGDLHWIMAPPWLLSNDTEQIHKKNLSYIVKNINIAWTWNKCNCKALGTKPSSSANLFTISSKMKWQLRTLDYNKGTWKLTLQLN